ncbi:MAG: hypothetical protein LBJ93_00670 [Clostridiales bacterium]|nr:hypothetical protein [Clostridiales bacterium]
MSQRRSSGNFQNYNIKYAIVFHAAVMDLLATLRIIDPGMSKVAMSMVQTFTEFGTGEESILNWVVYRLREGKSEEEIAMDFFNLLLKKTEQIDEERLNVSIETAIAEGELPYDFSFNPNELAFSICEAVAHTIGFDMAAQTDREVTRNVVDLPEISVVLNPLASSTDPQITDIVLKIEQSFSNCNQHFRFFFGDMIPRVGMTYNNKPIQLGVDFEGHFVDFVEAVDDFASNVESLRSNSNAPPEVLEKLGDIKKNLLGSLSNISMRASTMFSTEQAATPSQIENLKNRILGSLSSLNLRQMLVSELREKLVPEKQESTLRIILDTIDKLNIKSYKTLENVPPKGHNVNRVATILFISEESVSEKLGLFGSSTITNDPNARIRFLADLSDSQLTEIMNLHSYLEENKLSYADQALNPDLKRRLRDVLDPISAQINSTVYESSLIPKTFLERQRTLIEDDKRLIQSLQIHKDMLDKGDITFEQRENIERVISILEREIIKVNLQIKDQNLGPESPRLDLLADLLIEKKQIQEQIEEIKFEADLFLKSHPQKSHFGRNMTYAALTSDIPPLIKRLEEIEQQIKDSTLSIQAPERKPGSQSRDDDR